MSGGCRGAIAGAVVTAVALALAGSLGVRADPAGLAPYEIPLPGGRLLPAGAIASDVDVPDPPPFVLVQFHARPTNDLRRRLGDRGIHVGDRVHGTAHFARIDPGTAIGDAIRDAAAVADVRAVLAVPPDLKVHREVLAPTPAPYLETAVQGVRRAVIVFHRGTPRADAIQALDGRVARYVPYDPPRVWIVEASVQQFRALAQDPIVRWIRRPPPRLVALADALRQGAAVDDAQRMILPGGAPSFDGLDGTGVTVAVFDFPLTRRDDGNGHSDFLTVSVDGQPVLPARVEDLSTPPETESLHGEQVAGLIVGSGIQSGRRDTNGLTNQGENYSLRGVAPGANAALYLGDPGLESTATMLLEATTGSPISNHSYLIDYLLYDTYSAVLDKAALGCAEPCMTGEHGSTPQSVIAAAGNSGANLDASTLEDGRNCGHAHGYFSVFAPAKNAVVVGASYGNRDDRAFSRSARSSLGPTPDGRLKPDVVAPGCRADTPMLGPRVLKTKTDSYGTADCGTSFAAAVASGVVALMTQQWNEVRKSEDPQRLLPSTVKAALVASALDMVAAAATTCQAYRSGNDEASCVGDGVTGTAGYGTGPDYASGFGHVRADRAAEVVRERWFVEASVSPSASSWTGSIVVPPHAKALHVALAWDDPPYEGSGVSLALVNDLDLVLRAPDDGTGVRPGYGPWVPPGMAWNPTAGTPATDCPEGYDGGENLGFGGSNPPDAVRCVERSGSFVDAATGASRTSDECRDARNNVERIDVEAPVAGTWQLEVAFRNAVAGQVQDLSVAWSVDRLRTIERDTRCSGVLTLRPGDARWLVLAAGSAARVPGLPVCHRSPLEEMCRRYPEIGVCPAPCPLDPCPKTRLDVARWPRGLVVEIVDGSGETVASAKTGRRFGRARGFRPRAGASYDIRIVPVDPEEERATWRIPIDRREPRSP